MTVHRLADSFVDFRSDNTGAAAPEIVDALAAANSGTAAGYGNDRWTEAVQRRFSELFEKPVRVIPVATGTAANALALASLSPPWGAVYCSPKAHIETSEANATGFFGAGVKLVLVEGDYGKVAAPALSAVLAATGVGQKHKSQPAALNLTQATDMGAVYTLDEIRALTEIARAHKMKVHMDGARFANAAARLGSTPAEATWKAGIDVLSFGVTKNGGLLCDAIVVFSDGIAEPLAYHVRRAGQVWSKMRYAAAQLLAYVEDGLWLKNAARANALAARIDSGLKALPGVKRAAPIDANEVFLELPPKVMDGMERDGIVFFRRTPTLGRFVCRFNGNEAEVDALLASLRRNLAAAA